MQFESSWGTMQIGNAYAHNDAGMRKDLWNWLAHLDWKQGVLGGDFNMVQFATHTTVMSLIESTEWDKLQGEAALIDAWDSATRSSPGFTFHSLSHQGSWSRLDRIYFIGSAWLPNSEDMQVDVSSALFDHFPLILQLTDVNLDTMLSFAHSKPLLINNSILNHKHFRIRSVGKLIKQQGNLMLKKAIAMAETLVAKAGCTALCRKEMQDLMEAKKAILDWELAQNKTQRFLCRQWVLADGNDVPKSLYKKLRCKGKRQNLTALRHPLTSGSKILEMATKYYNELLNVQPETSLQRDNAVQTLLGAVDPCIELVTAARLEQPIEEAEILHALKKLPNDKCPGICGLSKELMLSFWLNLNSIICPLLNAIWIAQCMDSAITQGIIKLIPKNTFPKTLADWRPITIMGILHKILAKTIAIRITPKLRKHIHPTQTGFISGRSIFNNILTVQMGIEHVINSKQDMVMFQIDFEKAFDTVQWDFVSSIMTKMGFGAIINGFITLLGLNAYSRIVINGRLSAKVCIARSVRQGCPIDPLFFAIVTHPLYSYLDCMASSSHLQTL
ncbi:hypothetical protein L7F22_007660 [Adiantum nelumboides]|nr:hypothetical protein [Adiantum nelumboides]